MKMLPVIATLVLSLTPHAAPAAEPAGKTLATPSSTPDLRPKMQEMYQQLAALLTDVLSDERYNDPKNAKRIEAEIKQLADSSHDLEKMESKAKKTDPTLHLLGSLMNHETADAYRAYRDGRTDYARGILRNVPGYCIECHSRNPVGADFAKLPLEPTSELKPFERAQFYAATRQFDRSVETFQNAIKNAGKELRPYDIEYGLRTALKIAVRFKRDPALARNIIDQACANLNCPKFVDENLSAWRKSVVEWEKEKARKFASEGALFKEAQRLITRARAMQSYALDDSAMIVYLRASSTLYDLLQAYPQGKHVAEALLLQGMAYEVLSPRRMEDVHPLYYEACIRQAPHTETARQCYRRYESSMLFGFSGSGGTDLPQDVKDKLAQLWSIAAPPGAATSVAAGASPAGSPAASPSASPAGKR